MKLLIVMLLLFFQTQVAAQDFPKALVSTVYGKVSVSRNGKAIFLKQRDQIFGNYIIEIKKSGLLTLITQDNKFIEINQPGKYSWTDLSKNLNVKPTGISQKYFELIWHELFKPERIQNLVSPKVIGGAVGGASRGGCNILTEPANQSKISEDTLQLIWNRFENTQVYRVTLEDNNKNEVVNILTKDTSVKLLKRGLLKDESNNYYWHVTPSNDVAGNCTVSAYSFTLTSNEEKQKSLNTIISQEVKGEDEFIYYLKISNKLALSGWYKESYEYYEKAKAALPNASD